MKLLYLFIIKCVCCISTILAQPAVDKAFSLLTKADTLWLNQKKEEALSIYQKVEQNYSAHADILMEAYYRQGIIYDGKKKHTQAIPYFKKMIALELSPQEKNSKIMQHFMHAATNHYQQYMHLAHSYLGDIAYEQKRYKEALHYYKLADKKYPSYDQNTDLSRLITSEFYAQCYVGLQQVDSVLYTFLPYTLTSESYAAEALQQTKKYLKKLGTPPQFAQSLQQALARLNLRSKNIGEQYHYVLQTQLLGTSIELHTFTSVKPLSPAQQDKELDKYRKELEFIFKELLRQE